MLVVIEARNQVYGNLQTKLEAEIEDMSNRGFSIDQSTCVLSVAACACHIDDLNCSGIFENGDWYDAPQLG